MMLELAGMSLTLAVSLLLAGAIITVINNFYKDAQANLVTNEQTSLEVEDTIKSNPIIIEQEKFSELIQQNDSSIIKAMNTIMDNFAEELQRHNVMGLKRYDVSFEKEISQYVRSTDKIRRPSGLERNTRIQISTTYYLDETNKLTINKNLNYLIYTT
ncbi:MAG: hypothetical protein ATN32_05585 [Candidatus Epulonipiscium fishelsonii]|nr:MAG: hypothetical protein ATN32_05585 [Epulopiscium sp. AS2M-Bin002]